MDAFQGMRKAAGRRCLQMQEIAHSINRRSGRDGDFYSRISPTLDREKGNDDPKRHARNMRESRGSS